MNPTHSLIASLPLSCENRSVQSSLLTLPILSINPDGASGTHSALLATVAVKENKFTYPGILSSELESLDERERAYASLGRVETLSLPPEQEVEIQSGKLYLWRLCL